MKKLGFVIPWYGENIPGGAESELRGLVNHLYKRGVDLEVITTTVEKFGSDWSKNFHKPGLDTESCTVPVRRFKVRKRDNKAFGDINRMLMSGKTITREQEEIFMREMVNSPDMYEYIGEHKDEYGAFVFIPYMFGTSYYGCMECLEKAVYIPCFHDESYAYMSVFKELYPKTAGMLYNAKPEMELANRLYDLSNVKQMILGVGMDVDVSGEAKRFREKYKIDSPFILYAGRKTAGKNVDLLLKYFSHYKSRKGGDLSLVLIGGDTIEIPENVRSCVYDLGFVDIQDKYDAYCAAEVLCQPSNNESFSIVIMESWLCDRPVLVSGGCPVTKNFAIEAGGGLYFNGYAEFEGCVDYLLSHEEMAGAMGRSGHEYVTSHFAKDVIADKVLEFLEDIAD